MTFFYLFLRVEDEAIVLVEMILWKVRQNVLKSKDILVVAQGRATCVHK